MANKSVIITAIKPFNANGKTGEITFAIDGQSLTAKAFLKQQNGEPIFVIGPDLVEVKLFKKPPYGAAPDAVATENWIELARKQRSGGGGMKADPAKLEIDKARLNLEQIKHQDFLSKWASDADREASRQSLIVGQTCIERACELEAADALREARAIDINRVKRHALDLGKLVLEVGANVQAGITK